MNVGTLEIQILAQTARLQADMEKAQRTVGNAVGKINKVLGLIGAAVSVDFLLGLAQKSNEYGKSLAALSTQINGATNQIKELDAASRSLSVQFGTDPIKQAAGFYEILSAGITDTAKATEVLTEANRLAIGGNSDLMTAVDGLTSIVKGYGDAAGTASEIADTMFTASLAGKLSIEELSSGIGKVIPLATTMSVSLEEITAAISALTLGGISAKESVTGVRAILASVAKPSSEAARLAKEIGLEFNSAAIQANGFAKFLEEVKTKTKGSSDQMAILFGGVESLVPALALTGNAGIEFNNIMGQMANKAGATEEAFNKMAASPGFKFDKFMATMSNIAITLGDALATVLTPAAEMAANALNKLFGFNNVSGIEKQIQLVQTLTDKVESMANRKNIPLVGGILFDKKQFDLLEYQLENAKNDLAAMQKAQQTVTATQKQSTVEVIKNTVELEKNNAAVARSAKVAETRNKGFDTQLYLLKQYESEAKRARDITDSVATEQEILNQKLEELNRLKPYLTVETYERALKKLNGTTKETAVVTRNTTDEMGQMWIQAGRNIQTSLGNMVFDFFNDGLKGMVRNAGNAVLRIVSEFAGLKIAQSIGLAGMFGMTGTAAASGVGGTVAGIGNALNLASIGSNALTFAKGGFGVTGLVGGGLQALGGMTGSSSLAAFGGGFGGDALGGLAAGGFSSSAASAANLGSTMASFAGPAIAIAAVDQIVRLLAGNKAIEGVAGKILNYVPVIGPLINGLFGRGPLKQRETELTGEIGSSGQLDFGDLVTNFKAKGGLFRSDKNDFAKVDLVSGNASTDNNKALGAFTDSLIPYARQIAAQINETVGTVNTSLRGVADSLNLSVDPLDNFKRSINLISESGKALTEEQISNEINAITEEMARSLLPTVDQFAKFGESAVQTVTRLGAEFEGLTLAVQNLGAQSGHANTIISALTIAERSRIVELAGGIDAANQLTSFFFSNFLTGGEQLTLKTEQLSNSLTELGVSAALTADQFKELVQAEGTANELRIGLLKLAPAFLEVRNAQTSLGETTNVLATAERSLNDIRQELLGSYNKERTEFENTISKFKTISDKLRDFRESLLFSELSPLTPAQRLEEARNQFNQTRLKAASGDETALNSLPDVAQEFLKASQTYNASSAAYLSDFALVQNVLKNAEKAASSQVDTATKQLDELVKSVDYLLNIDNTTKTTNDLIKELIAATLKGAGNQQYSTADIKNYLAANPNLTPAQVGEAATRYGVSGDQLRAAGYDTSKLNQSLSGASISDKQILDFVNANRNNPMAIYNAAVANGVTSQRLSSVGGIAMTDIQKFVKDNKLQSFAKGTDFVHKTGIVMAHRGEAIGPSSMPDELKKIREELSALRKDQNEHTGALVNVIDITTKQNSQEISGAVNNAQTQKSWSERNKVAFK